MEVAQRGQKPVSIATGVAQHPTPAQQRRHPAEDIQARPMDTARGDPEALAALRPAAPQSRMQREPRLVFEDDGFVRAQGGEPFFRLSRNCRASSLRACTYE